MPKDLTYSNIDTDTTLAGNSDLKVASQKAAKAYVDTVAATKEATLTKGKVIAVSPITVSSNSGSVIGANVTVSIESMGQVLGVSPITVSSISRSVIGGNVTVSIESMGQVLGVSPVTVSGISRSVIGGNITVSIESLGNVIAVSPITVSANSSSVLGGNVTLSIESLGRVIGAENQITVSSNSGSVIGGNVTVSLETTVTVQAVSATGQLRIPFGTVSTQTSSGVTGTIQYDNANIYVCTATDTWVRTATTTSW